MQKIRTTVRVAGKEYTIASYDSQEHVQRVAAFVDRKMNELNLATRLPAQEAATLAAVTIADELARMREENERLRRMLETERAERSAGGKR